LLRKDHSLLDERRTRFAAQQAETSCRADEEDVMRGSLTPMLGAIGAGVCLTALTPAVSPDVAPDDVYAWRWTIDSVLDAQKKASPLGATLPATAPNDSDKPSWSLADRAERDPSLFPFGGI
jgi:hypothetical protein